MPLPVAPARLVFEEANRALQLHGHENLGSLSYRRGFLPTIPMPNALPPPWTAWELLVRDLPKHYRDLTLRGAVKNLPLLPTNSLPDLYLQRGTALLGTLAHATWYVESLPPKEIPASIAVPWSQLRLRLGRPQPVISYLELIVANFRMLDANHADPFAMENLRLNIATVDNPEEHRFYLLQTRILALGAPLVETTVRLQEAALAKDLGKLEAAFQEMHAPLRDIAAALSALNPRPESADFLHPLRWAKTVAPFAVPMTPGLSGPSGTSSPLFPLLDGLLGRRTHRSFLGKEMLQLKAGYPPLWRRLFATLEEVRIDEFVRDCGSSRVQALYQDLKDAYAGPRGFLGKHRRKVQAFLEVAFKVGRSVTIGGFQGAFTDRAWRDIDDALEESRRERKPRITYSELLVAPSQENTIPFSAVTTHSTLESAWCAIHGQVYDVTTYLGRHPGGPSILRLHIGRDATPGFERAHGGPFINKLVHCTLSRMRIGTLLIPQFSVSAVEELHEVWHTALDLVVEMETALVMDHSLLELSITSADRSDKLSTWQIQRGLESHFRFLATCKEPLMGNIVPKLAVQLKICGAETPMTALKVPENWMKYLESALRAGPAVEFWRVHIPRILQHDHQLIGQTCKYLRNGLIELETQCDNARLSKLSSCIQDLNVEVGKYMVLVNSWKALTETAVSQTLLTSFSFVVIAILATVYLLMGMVWNSGTPRRRSYQDG